MKLRKRSIDCVVIGGGAAGIFGAIAAKTACLKASVVLLEKSAVLLAKVRISGGGRCNVTHACFDPLILSQNYPRGSKELIGPFHRFQPRDTIRWFESRKVFLKTEPDGRIFPVTDQSETIIECLLEETRKLGIEIQLKKRIETIVKKEDRFEIELKEGEVLKCRRLLLATGNSQEGYNFAEKLGHTIQKPVPSLFTFNIPTSPLKKLSGTSIDPVKLQTDAGITQKGALLITHFGLSGPAVLKLSAWEARYFHEMNYKVELVVNWLPHFSEEEILSTLTQFKAKFPQKTLSGESLFGFSKNFWRTFLDLVSTTFSKRLHDIPQKDLRLLAHKLHRDLYNIEEKTVNKEEFVTCGGITLKEVDFKAMQSKICPGLFFAGEILDIDGVTGGFNFQNAWTTGYIAGSCLL